MPDTFYFAGGMYHSKGKNKEPEFNVVRPSEESLPYVTKDPKGLTLTKHHSSLYQLSPGLSEAILIDRRNGGVAPSPVHVKLSAQLISELRRSIDRGVFY